MARHYDNSRYQTTQHDGQLELFPELAKTAHKRNNLREFLDAHLDRLINYRLWFGAYKGSSLVKVALTDPSYFNWLGGIIKSNSARDIYMTTREILDNIVPIKTCNVCGGISQYFSLVREPNGTIDLGIVPHYYCAEHSDFSYEDHPSAVLVPISLEGIIGLVNSKRGGLSQDDRNKALNYFLEAIGWDFISTSYKQGITRKRRKPINDKSLSEFLSNAILWQDIDKRKINLILREFYDNNYKAGKFLNKDNEDSLLQGLNDKERKFLMQVLEHNYAMS